MVVVQQYLTCLASVTAPLPSAPLLPRTPGHQLQRTWQSLPSFLKFSATLSSPSGSSRTSSGALWYWEVWWLHRCWSQHGSRQPRKPCPLTAETDMGRQYNTPKFDTYTLWNWKPRKLCCKEGAFGKINSLALPQQYSSIRWSTGKPSNQIDCFRFLKLLLGKYKMRSSINKTKVGMGYYTVGTGCGWFFPVSHSSVTSRSLTHVEKKSLIGYTHHVLWAGPFFWHLKIWP